MGRIGKSLLRTTSVVALLAGVVVLAPGQASAQVNPFGMLNPMLRGFPPARGTARRGRVRETTKHERHSKEAKDEDSKKEAKDEDSDKQAKGEDLNKDEHSSGGNHGNQNRAEDSATTPSTPAGSAPKKVVNQPASNSTPPQPVADVPTFTPER